ncbi:MAG: HepT-like ribonuclease domain-containing protein, partial [Clostridiales bacterium]
CRFGNENVFYQDRDYRDAISMNILQIGELAKKLSNEYIQNNSQIPWRDIMRTRDLFAHHYGYVDSQELWLIASNDIPQLKNFCLEEVEKFRETEHSNKPTQSRDDEDMEL